MGVSPVSASASSSDFPGVRLVHQHLQRTAKSLDSGRRCVPAPGNAAAFPKRLRPDCGNRGILPFRVPEKPRPRSQARPLAPVCPAATARLQTAANPRPIHLAVREYPPLLLSYRINGSAGCKQGGNRLLDPELQADIVFHPARAWISPAEHSSAPGLARNAMPSPASRNMGRSVRAIADRNHLLHADILGSAICWRRAAFRAPSTIRL